MKIAVIDHIGNHGGGSRVVRALLPALKKLEPKIQITYFGNPASIRRERLAEVFKPVDIKVVELDSLRLVNSTFFLEGGYVRRAIQIAQSRWLSKKSWLPLKLSGDVVSEIKFLANDYDLVFYPWPFLLDFPKLEVPSVGIFHDFNFKYYFSGNFVFSPNQRAQLECEMPLWLDGCTPVVSTNFMAAELAEFYPWAAHKTHVVPLAPLGGNEFISFKRAHETIGQLGINTPYLLYPTHLCSHKNAGPLIAAVELLKERGHSVDLVLTGAGTESIRGHAHNIGLRLNKTDGNVIGLGYVTNHQMDSLIQCASVVVNSSLYEAGNGPGLDAWGRGTPVAMSNIPAFIEHLDHLGVYAKVFDPRSPIDIADKIEQILNNPEEARNNAERSRVSMSKVTWNDTAASYLKIFRQALNLDTHSFKQ